MEKVVLTVCPLCESKNISHFITCKDHYCSGESFELYCCKTCNFIFTQGVPSEQEIGRYYETPEYISHSDTKKGIVNKIYHRVRNRMLENKAKLVMCASGKKQGKILDIGTGTGYFSHTMKQKGWNVSAIEKSPDARRFAAESFGLEVQEENALYNFPLQSFDVITLWHVMEHIEPLNRIWQQLHDLLATDGTLIIAVPNHASADAEKYKEYWAAYDVPRHLWHFTPQTMGKFAEKYNFRIQELHPMPFDAFYVSMLSEKYRNKKPAFVRGMIYGLIARIKSIGKTEHSSSVIYVLKKQPDKNS